MSVILIFFTHFLTNYLRPLRLFINVYCLDLITCLFGFIDEKMNDFLRRNKDLFSSKREFLTKLREVRQKLMNKQHHSAVPPPPPTMLMLPTLSLPIVDSKPHPNNNKITEPSSVTEKPTSLSSLVDHNNNAVVVVETSPEKQQSQLEHRQDF